MLDPNQRSLYTAALTPPPGMVLDAAVATTYSLGPTTLLSIPLHLALLGSGRRRDLLDNGILLLEALRRVSDRICVLVAQGRVQLPSGPPNALYGLLESMLIECRAPHGGAFHPKLWLLRFAEPTANGDESAQPGLLRLVVLSRNLTMDRSWDLCLTLEGRAGRRNRAVNRPLGELIAALPGMAVGTVDDARVELMRRLAAEVRRVDWELPEGFDDLAFHVLGLRPGGWLPQESDRLAVISPFLSSEALDALRGTSGTIDILISRAEGLDALEPAALDGIGQVLVLDEAAETEDGEEPQEGDRAGLHAKALVLKKGWYTHLFMGSANATTAALVAGRNLELMVELNGRRSKIDGIDSLTRSDGLGAYLTPYQPPEQPCRPDAARRLAEQMLERARGALEQGGLRLVCLAQGDAWRLSVEPHTATALDTGVQCTLWPISVRPEQARDGAGLSVGRAVDLGLYPSASVTGLIAFELAVAAPEVALRFVLNLPIDGLPDDRDAAILRLLLNNRDGLLRYLLLLLGEQDAAEPFAQATATGGAFRGGWADADGEALPLFEEMTRAFSRDPERLADVRRVMDKLRGADGVPRVGEDAIPDSFLALWQVFDQALQQDEPNA